jgi:pilus assembly protein CpaE
MIRILLVDDVPATLDNLQKLLGFEDDIEVCGTAADGRRAIEEARRLQPDIILMDVNMPQLDGLQATEVIAEEVPGSPVIIMSVQGDRDYIRRAMQAGAREFLIKPFSGDDLTASIRRVIQLEHKKSTLLAIAAAAASPPAAGAGAAPRRGEVFVVFSGKGGVGKSVIASNLAVALGMETGGRVALVDLDLQFGDAGVLLNLDHSRSITDLADSAASDDPEFIEDVLTDGPEGIRVLLAPASPELADLVTTEHLRTVLQELRRTFDFIVVDTASHLGELNIEAIELATRVIVVTMLSIPAIKDTKLTLRVLESLNVEADRILLTLNCSDARGGLSREAVEGNLRFPIALQIPHDPKVVDSSVNRGTPFVAANPETEISRSIRELVSQLVPVGRPAPAMAVAGVGMHKRSRLFGARRAATT